MTSFVKLTAAVAIFMTSLHVIVTPANSQVAFPLKYLDNKPIAGGYRYQARCSIPCTGSYAPDDFKVTITLDTICRNFVSLGSFFSAAQYTRSSFWYLRSTKYISANSNSKCEFDVQFDHDLDNIVPVGTCRMDWFTPTTCLIADKPGVATEDGLTCFDVAKGYLNRCYNQTTFSECCNACNDYRRADDTCPFGDLQAWQCTSVQNQQCYNTSISGNCCQTCYEVEQRRDTSIADCPYGDRDPYFCTTSITAPHMCYNATIAQTCCETCHLMADSEIPNCLYGNKRPNYCNTLSLWDCYTSQNQRDCCQTCEVTPGVDPDCAFGDHSADCYTIDRDGCYNDVTNAACCDSCSSLANSELPDCAYGDRRAYCDAVNASSCSTSIQSRNDCCESCPYLTNNNCGDTEPLKCDLTTSEACYNPNTRSECCYTCLQHYLSNIHLPGNCRYGDKRNRCSRISSHDCYRPINEEECCATCYEFRIHELEDTCRYGDRTPMSCLNISAFNCYDGGARADCCETCSYHELKHLPTSCRYGNRRLGCSSLASFECYSLSTESECCESCTHFDQSDTLGNGCKYGDRIEDCYAKPAYDCYDPAKRSQCCKHCHHTEQPDNVGCEFGDRSSQCETIQAKDCYKYEFDCCQTCPLKVSPLNLTNCKYGDRRDCSDIALVDCADANVDVNCCERCYILRNQNTNSCVDTMSDCSSLEAWQCYNRESECCQTCQQYRINIPGLDMCTYGDRYHTCPDISPFQCYDPQAEENCCHTCYYKRESNLPDNCLYGNRVANCNNFNSHPSECYNTTRNEQCCESCFNIRTGDPNCRYGDKDRRCQDVTSQPYRCYDDVTYDTCCDSCPALEDTAKPGCEFGDRQTNCYLTLCSTYAQTNYIDLCCGTCWDFYSNRTTAGTTTTTAGPGGTGKQTSSTTVTTAEQTTTRRQTSRPPTTWRPRVTTIRRPPPTTTTDDEEYSTSQSYSFTTWFPSSSPSSSSSSSSPSSSSSSPSSSTSSTSSPSTDSTSTQSNESDDIDGLLALLLANTGAIVGGVVGGVVAIVIILVVACYFIRKNRGSRRMSEKYAPSRSNGIDHPYPLHHDNSYANPQHQHPMQPYPAAINGVSNPRLADTVTQPKQSGHTGFHGNTKQQLQQQQQPKPAPRRQQSIKDEEVYDYIDDSDVKTVISMPTRRPTLPGRDVPEGGAAVYFEPTNGDTDYTNPAFNAEGDSHAYHTLDKIDQKDPKAQMTYHEYMKL